MPKSQITTSEQAFQFIESFTNLERGTTSQEMHNYRLRRMTALLRHFGDPQNAIEIIHIAGTKGKGSTAVLVAAVLESAGYKTGVYASPHVSSYLERFTVALEQLSEQVVVNVVNRIRSEVDRLGDNLAGSYPPTTFELLTLLAFLVFRDSGCRYGVIEVGIGGRQDATNIVSPIASLITPLDLEHTQLLGDTLEKIAAEKGGIIKPGRPVFCSHQKQAVKKVLRNIAAHQGSPILFLDEETEQMNVRLSPEGTDFSLKLKGKKYIELHLTLLGEFQAENAALALLALSRLDLGLEPENYRRGFGRATLPGRMELVSRRPPVMLDGAHTPLSVKKLMSSYGRLYEQKGILIFGSVLGKNPLQMAKILAPYFTAIVISTPGTFKSSDPKEVFEIFKTLHSGTVLYPDPGLAFEHALQLSRGSLPVLVTGSFYMISEIRALREKLGHPWR